MHDGHRLGLSLGLTPEDIRQREIDWHDRASVSPSQIDAFELCPLKWYAQSVLRAGGLTGPPARALVLGSTVHKAIELFALGHYHDDAWRVATLETGIADSWPDAVTEARRQFIAAQLISPVDVVDVEVELPADTAPRFHGRRLHGFIDCVHIEGRTLVIRDWKTGKRAPTLRPGASGVSVQLGIYALAARAAGWLDLNACQSLRVEYAMTRTGTVHSIEPTDAELDQLVHYLDHTIERLAAFDEPIPRVNRLCDWCAFRHHCPAHGHTTPTHTEDDPMGILDQIHPAADATRQFLNLLIFGPPGAGKTYLSGSAARAGFRVLVLDTESGTMTIRDTSADVLTIDSTKTLRAAYTEIKHALDAGSFAYDLVVLDSLTEIQKLHVDELSDGGKRPLAIKQWGDVITTTRRTVRAFRDLPVHAMILALSKEITDDGGNGETTVRVRPAVHGSSLPHELGGFFDIVGYAGIRNGEHVIAFQGSDRVMAKDRSQTLDAIEPNDFGRIHGKVFGTWTEPEVEAPEA